MDLSLLFLYLSYTSRVLPNSGPSAQAFVYKSHFRYSMVRRAADVEE